MRNYYRFTAIIYLVILFATVACGKKDPEPTKPNGPSGSISHYIDGKLWQNTLNTTESPDIITRKTKGGLEITARNISGSDTIVTYFFLKDYNGSGRRFIINPLDSVAFPDTSGNFGFYGLQSILKRKQPQLSVFGTSGVVTIETVKADSLLRGTYSMEVTINDKQTIITDGSFNGVRLR